MDSPNMNWDYGSIDIDRLRKRSHFYAAKAGANQVLIGERDVPLKLCMHACMHSSGVPKHAP